MTKILYLDFDGCLHDSQVFCTQGVSLHIRTPGRTLFEWMHILEELLSPYPEVKIVLSTSWTASQSFEFACSQLSPDLQQRVIGSTYTPENLKYFDAWPRGRQVTGDVAARKPSSWFAVDDDDNGWPENSRSKLIKADGGVGISDSDVQCAIRRMLLSM